MVLAGEDGEQQLESPAADRGASRGALIARLAAIVALTVVGVAVSVDAGHEPIAIDARAGWERRSVDSNDPSAPTVPEAPAPRRPIEPGDLYGLPAGPEQVTRKADRRGATNTATTTTVAPGASEPRRRQPTVTRVIPEPMEAAPPPSSEPIWAKTTRFTDAGFVTTELGCADGTSAEALDEFFRERAGPVIGHDYQHVYPLGGERYLWVFQDTFLDHPGVADQLDQARFAHNTAMVQDGDCFTLFHRGTPSAPQSFEPGVGEEPLSRWFWPMGGELADGTLSVFWVEMQNTDHDLGPQDGLRWHPIRTWLGTYDAETLARLDFRLAPDAGVDPVYGYAVASDDEHTYLFGNSFDQNLYRQGGYENGPHSATEMWLARTPRGDLLAAPEYRTADGWSDDPSAARPITQRFWAENPMQPRYLGGQWVAATKADGYWGTELAIDVANDPWGPWTTVANGPAEPRGSDPLMLTYHAHLMPWLSNGALVVSLSQNARLMLRDAWPHPERYRMRFLSAALIEPPPSTPTTTTTTTEPAGSKPGRKPRQAPAKRESPKPTTTNPRPPVTTSSTTPTTPATTTPTTPSTTPTTPSTTPTTPSTPPSTTPTIPSTTPTTPSTTPSTTPTTPSTTPSTTPTTPSTTPSTTPTTPSTTPTTPSTTTTTTTTTTTPSPPPCPVGEDDSVWDILASCPQLSKAVSYLERTDLVRLLDDPDHPVTLLVPDNDAFEVLEDDPDLSELLKDPAWLDQLFGRHILFEDRVLFEDLFEADELPTHGGDVLAVNREDRTIEDASALQPDAEQGDDGVVHAIDRVLLQQP